MVRYHEIINPDDSGSFSIAELIEMYNEAVETIWILQKRLHELSAENETLWEDFEELTDHMYG